MAICISSGWASVIVNVLTLGVLGCTLYWVWRYTQAANKTAEAARAQAEAVLMPVVVVHALADRSDDSIVKAFQEEDGALPVLPEGDVMLRNVGAGPALNLKFQIENPGPSNPANRKRTWSERQNNVLAKDAELLTGSNSGWLHDEATIVMHYESASGIRYQTFAHFVRRESDIGVSACFLAGQRVQRLDSLDKGRVEGAAARVAGPLGGGAACAHPGSRAAPYPLLSRARWRPPGRSSGGKIPGRASWLSSS